MFLCLIRFLKSFGLIKVQKYETVEFGSKNHFFINCKEAGVCLFYYTLNIHTQQLLILNLFSKVGKATILFMEIQMKKKKKIEKVFETKEQREQRYADNIKKARSFARQCGIKVR